MKVLVRAAALSLISSVALATPADLYGAMSDGIATAGAQTAAVNITAAFYNPANLGFFGATGHPALEIGYAAGIPSLNINRSVSDSNNPTQPTSASGWVTVATVVPLGGKLGNIVSLGAVVFIPTNTLLHFGTTNPQDPQWLRYQNDPDATMVALGLGFHLGKYVAIGAGVQVLAGVVGSIAIDADIFTKVVSQRDISVYVNSTVAPSAGISFSPFRHWNFSVSYKGAIEVPVKLPVDVALGELGTLSLIASTTVDYTPMQVSAGAHIPLSDELSFDAQLAWQHWSQMPNPALQISETTGGTIATTLGLSSALGIQTTDSPPGFKDTLSPAASLDYVLPGKVVTLRAGYAYRPTYVPNQVSTTNYLDSDAHIVGFGGTIQFFDPLELLEHPIKIVLGGQVQILTPRTITKDQQADPVGNYTISGSAFALAASLRYDF